VRRGAVVANVRRRASVVTRKREHTRDATRHWSGRRVDDDPTHTELLERALGCRTHVELRRMICVINPGSRSRNP
jgi:hypothetical protein